MTTQPQPQPSAIPKGSTKRAECIERLSWHDRYFEKCDELEDAQDLIERLKVRIEQLEAVKLPDAPTNELHEQLTSAKNSNATLRGIKERQQARILELEENLKETRLQCAILSSNGTLRRNRNDNAPTGMEIAKAANPDTVSREPNTPFDKWIEKKPSKMVTRPEVGSPAASRNERKFQMEPPKELNT